MTLRVPPGVPAAKDTENEKTLSPGVTSPLVPLSKKGCDAEPPTSVKFPTTVIPVLGGVVAGITVTVRSVLPGGVTIVGLAFIAAKSVVPPPLQVFGVVDWFRGANGLRTAKSFALLSVS